MNESFEQPKKILKKKTKQLFGVWRTPDSSSPVLPHGRASCSSSHTKWNSGFWSAASLSPSRTNLYELVCLRELKIVPEIRELPVPLSFISFRQPFHLSPHLPQSVDLFSARRIRSETLCRGWQPTFHEKVR